MGRSRGRLARMRWLFRGKPGIVMIQPHFIDGGLEVFMTLESQVFERLRLDETFTTFAELRCPVPDVWQRSSGENRTIAKAAFLWRRDGSSSTSVIVLRVVMKRWSNTQIVLNVARCSLSTLVSILHTGSKTSISYIPYHHHGQILSLFISGCHFPDKTNAQEANQWLEPVSQGHRLALHVCNVQSVQFLLYSNTNHHPLPTWGCVQAKPKHIPVFSSSPVKTDLILRSEGLQFFYSRYA